MKKNQGRTSNLIGLEELTTHKDARAPQADVSNAASLMGDVYRGIGDVDDDDDSPYGDVSSAGLETWDTLIGDAEGPYGAPTKVGKFLRSKGFKTGATIALGAGGAAAGYALIDKLVRRRKAKRAAVAAAEAQNARNATIQNQIEARSMLGKIPRTALMPFYQVAGATLNAYPLAPTERFAANDLKFNMDMQSTQTPYEAEIVNGVFAGVTWTLTATGVVAARFWTAVMVTVGISTLTANPGTIFTVVGTFPLINGGVLTVAANPFSFTISQGWYARLLIFPWQLVTNKPLLALGSYNNANPIVVQITGLPANATVNMIVPGSLHTWSIGMRNRLA